MPLDLRPAADRAPRIAESTLRLRLSDAARSLKLPPKQAAALARIICPPMGRLPARVTRHPAGTKGKISAMVGRLARGERLFHHSDAGSAPFGLGYVMVVQLPGQRFDDAFAQARGILGIPAGERLPDGVSVEAVPLPEPPRLTPNAKMALISAYGETDD